MPVSLDVGTAFLCKGTIKDDKPSFTLTRNCFIEAVSSSDTEDIVRDENWSYVKLKDKIYILGEDALRLKLVIPTERIGSENISATKIGELRRPMRQGVLNTNTEPLSIAIIQELMRNLLGKPSYEGEVLCYCSPSSSIDGKVTTEFHQKTLSRFFSSLGYSVECISEALAIIWSERPSSVDPVEGNLTSTGIAISCGAGMVNVCMARKRMPLIQFSVAQSGDWIDEEVAKVTGNSTSVVQNYKERQLDLSKIDDTDLMSQALDIFYSSMIENTLTKLAEQFNKLEKGRINYPLEVVVAGGTSKVPGFIEKFKSILMGLNLPFQVSDVKLAKYPLYAVSNGCLKKALDVENKNKKKSTSK